MPDIALFHYLKEFSLIECKVPKCFLYFWDIVNPQLVNSDKQHTFFNVQSILKEDKENYMALVFLGISLQETGPKDQALLAFKKAIRLDSTKIVAWNGLLNYYEKTEKPQNMSELIDAYLTVMKLEE